MHAKCTIPRQKKSKKFLGRGYSPLPDPSSIGEWAQTPPLGVCGASILAPSALDFPLPPKKKNKNPGSASGAA